jgi:predicted glycosyltransferase involved in capsule biosynthesis
MQISQVTTCKGRWDSVEKNWKKWVESGVDELIFVDAGCPEKSGDRLFEISPDVRRMTTVLKVDPASTNDRFHLTKFRNLGALRARNELLFFCDADCSVSPFFIEQVRATFDARKRHADLMIADENLTREDVVYRDSELPLNWAAHGQCFIRNYIFVGINGYDERHQHWGGEAYDLYIRAARAGAVTYEFPRTGLRVIPHSDLLRDRFLEKKFSDIPGGRQQRYSRSLRYLEKLRRIERACPGRRMDAMSAHLGHIGLIRHGQRTTWIPGEVA